MSFRRVGWLAATALATLLWMSCGEVYRPVVIPIAATPPSPSNFHAVFGVSTNVGVNPGTALQIDVSGDSNIGQANMGLNPTHAAILPNNSKVFVASAGSVIPGNLDLITAFAPAPDSPTPVGLGTLFTYSLPNVGPNQSSGITSISEPPGSSVVTMILSTPIGVAQVGDPIVVSGVNPGGYNGNFTISSVSGSTIQYSDCVNTASGLRCTTGLGAGTGGTATVPIPTFCSYQPDYVTTAQNTAVFVANYGVENQPNCSFASTDSVALLNSANNNVTNIAYLNPGNASPAPHPVAMVETPNAQNLYVVNEGNNTVSDISPVDLSTMATIPVGNTPVWAVARPDNQRVYVLAQGSGTLIPIDVTTNTVLQSQTNLNVGAGANFVLYDPSLNRLFVTNPTTGNVFVYSATGGLDPSTGNPNDTPTLLAMIPMGTSTATNPTAPCPGGCSPVSVAALPDGSRFYVASYQSQNSCTDTNLGGSPCIVPMVTVFNATSMAVKPPTQTLLPSAPSLSLLTSPPYTLTQYAVPPVASCVAPAVYAPGTTRFRMFTTASSDSSHVYVSICDAGSIADISTKSASASNNSNNTPDLLVTDIAAPFGACTPGTCASVASITSFSITSNVVTFQAANNFLAGQQVQISGMGAGTYFNGQDLTVLATGLSSTQFECAFTHADVTPTSDSGTATTVPSAVITSFSITNDIGTFTANNTFTPGTRVALSNFTSTAGTQLNGLTVTVLATGLSSTQFEANLNLVPAPANVGATPVTGNAVPIVPPQSPIFLLTGQ